jgi:hypothetical protein
MVSVWRADTKDTLPADTTNVFCSSDSIFGHTLCLTRDEYQGLLRVEAKTRGGGGESTVRHIEVVGGAVILTGGLSRQRRPSKPKRKKRVVLLR